MEEERPCPYYRRRGVARPRAERFPPVRRLSNRAASLARSAPAPAVVRHPCPADDPACYRTLTESNASATSCSTRSPYSPCPLYREHLPPDADGGAALRAPSKASWVAQAPARQRCGDGRL